MQNVSIAIAPFAAGLLYADSGPGTVFAVCAAGVAIGAGSSSGSATLTDAHVEAHGDRQPVSLEPAPPRLRATRSTGWATSAAPGARVSSWR